MNIEKEFDINIIKPDSIIYQGKAVSLIVPAETGYLGVLADHAPLVASVSYGKIIIREQSGKVREIVLKEKGFLEVLKNKATILLS